MLSQSKFVSNEEGILIFSESWLHDRMRKRYMPHAEHAGFCCIVRVSTNLVRVRTWGSSTSTGLIAQSGVHEFSSEDYQVKLCKNTVILGLVKRESDLLDDCKAEEMKDRLFYMDEGGEIIFTTQDKEFNRCARVQIAGV